MLVELHAKTDVGRVRRGNEDNFLLLDLTAARAWSGSDGPENPDDMRGQQIRLATKDQSLVQQLVDVGQISEAEAETHMFRNVILQALGAQNELTPATARIQLRQGDMVLLCSDGLSGKLRNEDIRQIVADADNLGAACDALVAEANNRGGEDNITVVLARFTGDELRDANDDRITVELPPLEEDRTLDETEADTQHQ